MATEIMATSTTKLTHTNLLTRFTRFALASLKMRLASPRFARRRNQELLEKFERMTGMEALKTFLLANGNILLQEVSDGKRAKL